MAGQTINDRLLAARHSLAGQGLAKSVCKATTEEMIGPKKKHLDCKWHFCASSIFFVGRVAITFILLSCSYYEIVVCVCVCGAKGNHIFLLSHYSSSFN